MTSPLHALQPSFTAGELAPSLLGRVDFAKYASGLKTARNGIVHPEGGFSNRTGFQYVASAKYSGRKCRLIPFEFSATQTYMIEFGDLYCRFYTNGGQILSIGVPYEIATPYLEAEIPFLKVVQSANTLYIASAFHAPATLVRVTDSNWVLSTFPFINGPFNGINADPSNTISWNGTTLTSSAGMFKSGHIGALFKLLRSQSSSVITQTLFDLYTETAIWAYNRVSVVTSGTWTGTLQIFVGASLIATYTSANDANYNTFIDISSFGEPVQVSAFFIGPANHVQVTLSADAFTYPSIYKITSLVSASIANATLQNPSQDNDSISTPDWYEGSWSAIQGWPTVVGFFQDRLVWASSANNPESLWASQVGDYVDYGISDPLVDSDAISVNLNSRKVNAVQNLLSMIRLVPITLSAEFSIGPGASGVFAPTSIEQKVQGYRGGSSVQAVVIGNTAIYIEPMGTVVRNIGYQFYTDTFTGDNLSLLSSHLFRNFTILDMAYQQEPDSIIWMVRNDGKMLSLTYMPEQQVVGWTHHDTQGYFEAVATIPNSSLGINEVWAVVNRTNPSVRSANATDSVTIATGVNDAIDFQLSDTTLHVIFIPAGTYTGEQIALAIQTALNDLAIAFINEWSVVYANSHFDIYQNPIAAINYTLLFGTGANKSRSAAASLGWDTVDTDFSLNPGPHTYDQVSTFAFVNSVRMIERMAKRLPTFDVKDQIHLDCSITYSGAPATVISGLDFLNGQSVMALADGSVQGPFTVSGGSITLDEAASIVHVGLAYTTDFETLYFNGQMQDGSSQGRRQRVAQCMFRFLNSVGGYIGTDFDHLHTLPQRTTQALGTPIPLLTYDHRQPISSSWQNNGRVVYRQTDPLPVTILAVVPNTEMGDL